MQNVIVVTEPGMILQTMVLYHFELFGMACDPWPLRRNFTFSRGQCDPWHGQITANLNFGRACSGLNFGQLTMSRLAKDDVTRDSDQFRRRQGGPWPVTRRNGTVVGHSFIFYNWRTTSRYHLWTFERLNTIPSSANRRHDWTLPSFVHCTAHCLHRFSTQYPPSPPPDQRHFRAYSHPSMTFPRIHTVYNIATGIALLHCTLFFQLLLIAIVPLKSPRNKFPISIVPDRKSVV